MKSVNMHEAKTHLSKLVEAASRGEPFVIAKAGKAMVRVVPMEDAPAPMKRRLGVLAGQFTVPDDIKTSFEKEINEMFYGEE